MSRNSILVGTGLLVLIALALVATERGAAPSKDARLQEGLVASDRLPQVDRIELRAGGAGLAPGGGAGDIARRTIGISLCFSI